MRIPKFPFPLLMLAALCAAQPTQQRDPLPVPGIPGYKTLKCDFHLHTVFSDGEVWPTTRVVEAFRDGLDAIALTDHASYVPHKDDVKPDGARPHEIARRVAAQLGVILVPGIEVNDGNIHFNALFVTDANALRGVPLKEALARARQQGGFAFWNHPGWKGKPEWFPLVAGLYDARLFNGMELLNGPSFYPEAYPWIEERKLTILANSDAHRPMADSYEKRGRPVTLVFAKTADAAGVREALQARRTAAWMNGEVWGFEEHLAALVGGALKAEPAAVTCRPGQTAVPLVLRNTSALPFELRLKESPAWLKGRAGAAVKPEAATGISLTVAKDAPVGKNRMELVFEVSNFNTGPGRKLTAKIPFTVTVER